MIFFANLVFWYFLHYSNYYSSHCMAIFAYNLLMPDFLPNVQLVWWVSTSDNWLLKLLRNKLAQFTRRKDRSLSIRWETRDCQADPWICQNRSQNLPGRSQDMLNSRQQDSKSCTLNVTQEKVFKDGHSCHMTHHVTLWHHIHHYSIIHTFLLLDRE